MKTKTQTETTKRRGQVPFLEKVRKHFGGNPMQKLNSMLREATTPQQACDMLKAASEGNVTAHVATLKKVVRQGIEKKMIAKTSPLAQAFTRRRGRPVATAA